MLLPAQAALERGLLPDDETLKQLSMDPDLPIQGRDIASLCWPEEPLRFVLISAHHFHALLRTPACPDAQEGQGWYVVQSMMFVG